VSNRFCFYRQILKRRLPDKNAKDQCAHRFVSIFHMRGQRTVELASQLRISVASDTWHISVISVFIPELSVIISRCDFQAPNRVIYGGTSHGQRDEKWRYGKARLTFFYLTYLHVI
jgi:hypothetical protein